jgi:hypothetical protein
MHSASVRGSKLGGGLMMVRSVMVMVMRVSGEDDKSGGDDVD